MDRRDRFHSALRPPVIRNIFVTISVVLVFVVTACGSDEPVVLAGMVRTPAPNVGEVVLPAVSDGGVDFATKAGPGNLLVVYFGYTSCPDVCPTTMADLRRAVQELGDDAERIEMAIITVDPDRDDPQQLTTYVRVFFPDGVALRTEDPVALRGAAEAYGAAYEVTTNDEGLVEVAHSAFLYAIDESGNILVQWPFGMTSEHMRHDLAHLLSQTT